MPREKSLQVAVLKRLAALAREDPSLIYRKRHGSMLGVAGDPDIYGLYRGVHFEIELKQPGQYPTPLQILRASEWERAGALAGVVQSLEDFDQFWELVVARFRL